MYAARQNKEKVSRRIKNSTEKKKLHFIQKKADIREISYPEKVLAYRKLEKKEMGELLQILPSA